MGSQPRVETQSSPAEDGRCDGDGCLEVSSELVVACGDASPVLEGAKGALDTIALTVGDRIVGDRTFPRAGGRDDGLGAPLGEGAAQAHRVIAPVGDEAARGGPGGEQFRRD